MDAFEYPRPKPFVLCMAMIDQGRKIGNDPVGYKCANDATTTITFRGLGFHVCDHCAQIAKEQPDRIEFWLRDAIDHGN